MGRTGVSAKPMAGADDTADANISASHLVTIRPLANDGACLPPPAPFLITTQASPTIDALPLAVRSALRYAWLAWWQPRADADAPHSALR